MLTVLDDYPIHQTSEPLAHVSTSDHNFYDRYWYNAHDRGGLFYFGVGACRYANLGIFDCSLSIAIDGEQHAFHGSRRAPKEAGDLSCGPFRIEILEPMGRHRVSLQENETGISCDLTFTPTTVCVEEGRQTLRNERHVVMDATRLDQFGKWQGWIRFNGRELLVESESTFGLKDRSWGVRPVGDRFLGGAPLSDFQAIHFNWLPIHWENRCSLAGWFEDDQGNQWHTDQAFLPKHDDPKDASRASDPDLRMLSGIVDHELTMIAGTRRASSGVVTMNDASGESLTIHVKPVLVHRMKGLGYQHPEWGHGRWQGELKIEGESWREADLDPLALENLHVQQIVVATSGDEIGHGVLEQLHIGPSSSYGFSDWFDGAS